MTEFFLVLLLSFLAVLALTPPLRTLAIRAGFVDEPDERKHHDGPVPPVGGMIIFSVFCIGALLGGADIAYYWPLFAALFLLVFVGMVDDKRHVEPWIKFGLQFLAAFLIVVPGQAQLHHLGDLFGFGTVGLGIFSIPLSIFCVALLINSINLMDGLDGLAGGMSLIVLFWLMLACVLAGQWEPFMTISVLAGAVLGFLYYNMRHPFRDKASVFLGDAGSMGLGLVLAWFCIGLAQGPEPVIAPVSVAWIIALPVIDACGQFFRRMKEGRHPFSPDRGHFHHHFVHAGIPVGQSTVLILLIGFLLGSVGYFGTVIGVPSVVLSFGWVALLASHVWLSLRPKPFIKFLSTFNREALRKPE